MFFLELNYGISTILIQILISLRFPIYTSKGVHWCLAISRLFELSEASVHWCFKKTTAPKISTYLFPSKTSRIPFKYTRRLSRDFSKKSSCSVEKLLASDRIFQNLKNMQGKAGDRNLKACNLL